MDTSSRMNFANLAFGDLNKTNRCIKYVDSDGTSSTIVRIIILSNMLPLHAQKDGETEDLSFNYNEDSPLWELKDGFSPDIVVFYVGLLNADIDVNEHEKVVGRLMDDFNCLHTFLANELFSEFYHDFCKHHLWPIFHYMFPVCGNHGDQFDQGLWKAYISANKIFANKVLEVENPEADYIWINDYHLMAFPVFLRNKRYRAKLRFFLHSPFPALEIYRKLPVTADILRILLNCDLIGFHTFNYASHFLSCYSRSLELDCESKRDQIGLDYSGRTVYIKILPIGIHLRKVKNVLNITSTSVKVKEFEGKFKGKHVIVAVDDMNLYKAISLKLLAFEQLLRKYENLPDIVVLVQIINPERSSGEDHIEEVRRETYGTADRINQIYGSCGHQLVILIDRPVDQCEKSAYYAASECCIINAVRDGMNLVPHMYLVCRQGSTTVDEARGIMSYFPRTSVLIIYEYIGCSPSLSGAIRINSWDISSLVEAMRSAVSMDDSLSQLRHEQNYSYVQSHDVAYWARSFLHSMERACLDHYNYQFWGMGFSFTFKAVALSLGFQKLFSEIIVPAYKRTNKRAIFPDFDGTLVPHSSTKKNLCNEVVTALNTLCDDPKNTVFIVSRRGRSSLTEWLAPCKGLGLAAEHGYFIRWKKTSEWQSSLVVDLEWKTTIERIMNLYTEATDGSTIEVKESALAKELSDHLKHVIVNEPAVVRKGKNIVEVKPQDASKGLVTEKVISTMVGKGEIPDFILCIGDDRSDEDMYDGTLKIVSSVVVPAVPEIFFCTLEQKPSKAKYFVDDTFEVQKLLQWLANVLSTQPSSTENPPSIP